MAGFELPDGYADRVRLFPLPDLVLFPCAAQPLHIFESRYCEMLEDALEDDQLIAMATLQPGYDNQDYYGRPPIADPVCLGRIATCRQRDTGTYDLLLVGLKRAMIEDELPPDKSYRQAKVRVIENQDTEPSPIEKTLSESLIARLQRLAPTARTMLRSLKQRELGLGELTDVLAFHTNLNTDTKLELLTEGCPLRRAELMLESLPLAESFDGGDLPPFSLN